MSLEDRATGARAIRHKASIRKKMSRVSLLPKWQSCGAQILGSQAAATLSARERQAGSFGEIEHRVEVLDRRAAGPLAQIVEPRDQPDLLAIG